MFVPVPVFADSEDGDILDRRDVQRILFGNESFWNDAEENPFIFRGEFIGTLNSLSVGAYFYKKINPLMKSYWGASYTNGWKHDRLLALKGTVLLTWERFFLQPVMGLDAGFGVLPRDEQNLFSHGIVGMDFLLAGNFGITARETWEFSNEPLVWEEVFYFGLKKAMFELGLFWQI